jgi:hypothetical protein
VGVLLEFASRKFNPWLALRSWQATASSLASGSSILDWTDFVQRHFNVLMSEPIKQNAGRQTDVIIF